MLTLPRPHPGPGQNRGRGPPRSCPTSRGRHAPACTYRQWCGGCAGAGGSTERGPTHTHTHRMGIVERGMQQGCSESGSIEQRMARARPDGRNARGDDPGPRSSERGAGRCSALPPIGQGKPRQGESSLDPGAHYYHWTAEAQAGPTRWGPKVRMCNRTWNETDLGQRERGTPNAVWGSPLAHHVELWPAGPHCVALPRWGSGGTTHPTRVGPFRRSDLSWQGRPSRGWLRGGGSHPLPAGAEHTHRGAHSLSKMADWIFLARLPWWMSWPRS